jgi:hypothetical protein
LEGFPRHTDHGGFGAALFDNVVDAWAFDVVAHNFTEGVQVLSRAKRVTIDQVMLTHSDNDIPCSGSAPAEFTITGSQVLINRSASFGAKKAFYVATQRETHGPNVVLNFNGKSEACTSIEPHMRWATGLLVDNANVNDKISFVNRATGGSGHGWAIGWGVVWNSMAGAFLMESPPGATNWTIGGNGKILTSKFPNGTYDSFGKFVTPTSLYLAQLCERLGPQAVKNIGYK